MPLIERPLTVTNRAITIDATPDKVWPWLAQMSELPRAGFYGYEWVERAMGLKVKNASRIMPEYQELHAGDVVDRQQGNMLVRVSCPGRPLCSGHLPAFGSTRRGYSRCFRLEIGVRASLSRTRANRALDAGSHPDACAPGSRAICDGA